MPKVSPTEEVTTGRTGRVRRVTASISEINVVPLVDVMLVLLVIFMVTAPMLQRGVDVNLPVARRSEPIAEALIATAAGLFAAIPAVYFYNHFVAEVKDLTAAMDDFALEFLNIAERNFT